MAAFESMKSKAGFVGGLLVFALLLVVPMAVEPQIKRMLAILALCAIWWGTEAISIYATALVPAVLLPLLGILPLGDALAQYANRLIFLFLGGFLIARAMMKWGIDRRLAVAILGRVGASAKMLVFYFMLLTALLSAFLSNTATTAMMLPIALAILTGSGLEAESQYGKVLLLGIAYAATIGGVATLVGTPPNVLLAGFSSSILGQELSFFEWLKVGLPYAVVMLPLTWWFLWSLHRPKARTVASETTIEEERKTLGPMERGGKYTVASFALVATLWLTRPFWHMLPFEAASVVQDRFDDSIIALSCALLLFIVPTDVRRWKFPLVWADTRSISFGILFLFGGGLALGRGLFESGAAQWMAGSLSLSGALPPIVLILAVAVIASFLSEIASNTAVANMLIPILIAVATASGVSPYLLIVPATVACSNVFMLPVSTPPNAIVYGSGKLSMSDMIRTGFLLHLIGIVVMTLLVYLITGKLFGVFPA
ncbi:MAG: DASS family sodium-coupled anion symporter [Candidatus Eisenbacteria bacterium]|nr:DASS family sodium-coupled anion symporter [Candidatus Eisenbacteria bacterium]